MSVATEQPPTFSSRYRYWIKLGLIGGAVVGSAGLLSYALLAIGKSGALLAAGKTASTQVTGHRWTMKVFEIIFPILVGLLSSLLIAYQQSRTINQQKQQQQADNKQYTQELANLEAQLKELQTELKQLLSKMTSEQQKALVARYDLQQIKGIGPKLSQALQAGGIHTIEDLANHSPDDLQTLLKSQAMPAVLIQKHKVDQWVVDAQKVSQQS
ncbi:MAG: DUF4332 domain-containing protein [bacterium]